MKDDLVLSGLRLEQQSQRLLQELDSWTQIQLQHRPSLAAWTAIDLVDHLQLTEAAVLESMQRNLPRAQAIPPRDRLRTLSLLGVMLLPIHVRVPSAARQVIPSEKVVELSTLREVWSDTHKAMMAFVRDLSRTQQTQGLFRHPVGGWTTAGGALLFLRSHLWHHRYQFRRLRKSSLEKFARLDPASSGRA